MTTENTPAPTGHSTWKSRHPFAVGITCGIALSLIAGGGIWGWQNYSTKHQTANLEQKRVDLLRPLLVTPAPATAPAAVEANPADMQAACQRFVDDLQALQTKAKIHVDALRDAASNSYLASRSSEIDMDELTAKANALKQDLADFQQTYPRIDPLISSLTPDQINQVSDIKNQFEKYQRFSERIDNTLVSIDDYRNRLAGSEAYASENSSAPQDTNNQPVSNDDTAASVVSSTTTQTTTTVISQPGSVYTDPVYYYDNSPSVSLWFGYSSYDPFWATSYCYPYWSYKNRYCPPPPPPHHPGPPHNGSKPPGPPPGKPFPGNNPPPWTRPSNPGRPGPDTPRPTPPITRPDPGFQPKPTPPRTTITIPSDNNNRPNPRNLPWQQNPGQPQNRTGMTTSTRPATNNTPAYVPAPSPATNSKSTPDSPRPSWQQQRPAPSFNNNQNNSRPSPGYTPSNRPDPSPSRSYSPPPSRPEPAPRQQPPSRPSFQPANPPSQPSNGSNPGNSGGRGGRGGGNHR